MKYRSTIKIKNAIIITEQLLKDLQAELDKGYHKFSYKAYLVNNDTVEFDSINEVVQFDNALDMRIESLEISGYDDSMNMCLVQIKRGNYNVSKYESTTTISFTTCNKEFVETFKVRVYKLFKRNEQPVVYNIISKFTMIHTLLIELLVLFCLILDVISKGKMSELSDIKLNFLSVFYNCLIIIGVSYWCDKFRTYLFPAIVFYLGDEIEKENKRKSIRSIILTVIILGLIVGVISGIITYNLTK